MDLLLIGQEAVLCGLEHVCSISYHGDVATVTLLKTQDQPLKVTSLLRKKNRPRGRASALLSEG